MSGKIIFLIVKTILRIVGLEMGFPARAQKKMFVGRADNLAGKWPVENARLCLEDTNVRIHSTFVPGRHYRA